MGERSFSVSAPGKIILHGEHAVVYGKTALAATVNHRTTLTFHAGSSDVVELDLQSVGARRSYEFSKLMDLLRSPLELVPSTQPSEHSLATPHLILFPRLLERVKEFVDRHPETLLVLDQKNAVLSFFCVLVGMFSSVTVPPEGLRAVVKTALTVGSGTGSSASFGVCVSAALLHYIRLRAGNSINVSRDGMGDFRFQNTDLRSFDDRDRELVSRWSLLSERVMHGNPSGIDNYVCTFGSIIEFRKGADVQKIPSPKNLRVLMVYSGVTRATSAKVREVATRRETYPAVVDRVMDAIDALTITAANLLRRLHNVLPENEYCGVDEVAKLETLIDMNQGLLSALGVSCVELDRICSIVQSHGLHCKLTGAGGGGYAYVLLAPSLCPSLVNDLCEDLQSKGFTTSEVALGGPGVELHAVS